MLTQILKGPIMQLLIRTATGVMAISLYFADIISDVQVLTLLYTTGNLLWAAISLFLLVAQFLIVWLRVLPYLASTFGTESNIYVIFLWTGFPAGLLFLDMLMFLEPFGLLTVLPFPAWMRQFIPAYKATRVIAEVVIESVPQSVLQGFIYVKVITDVREGVAEPRIQAMFEFADALPKSILISTLATLKTWMELVSGARQAGLTVMDKAFQLWHVGAGLPLDALKKGTIVDWDCPYKLDPSEISPLLDALTKNGSLVNLSMAKSGVPFDEPNSTGQPLVQKMASSSSALSSLETLIIRPDGYKMLIDKLRDPDAKLEAIRKEGWPDTGTHFFTLDGPQREEILFMGDLMRIEGLDTSPSDAVVKLLSGARAGKIKRRAWEEKLTELLCVGDLRRGQLQSLISADTLKDVGFTAKELLEARFTLPVLREGGYMAAEMRSIGKKAGELGKGGYTPAELRAGGYRAKDLKNDKFTASDMKQGGYPALEMKNVGFQAAELYSSGYEPKELREGTFPAKDLKPLGLSALTLRDAGFEAIELREVSFTLSELKEGGYTSTELKAAKYYAHEMKAVGFAAVDLKRAGYGAVEIRGGGYTALQMKEAGFKAKQVKTAGYTSTEALAAGWTIDVLKDAGYEAGELREAKCTAQQLKDVGFNLADLRGAGFSTPELQEVGYGAEELRAAGTSLAELASAGASVADLKAAGISAIGLKAEGMALLDMKEAGYPLKELKMAGYTAIELRGVQFEAHELTAAGYSVKELRNAGYEDAEERESGWLLCQRPEGRRLSFARAQEGRFQRIRLDRRWLQSQRYARWRLCGG